MYQTYFEQWETLNKTLLAPYSQVNKLIIDLAETTTKQNLEFFNHFLGLTSNQGKQIFDFKKPEDMFALQTNMMIECMQSQYSYFMHMLENVQNISAVACEMMQQNFKALSQQVIKGTSAK